MGGRGGIKSTKCTYINSCFIDFTRDVCIIFLSGAGYRCSSHTGVCGQWKSVWRRSGKGVRESCVRLQQGNPHQRREGSQQPPQVPAPTHKRQKQGEEQPHQGQQPSAFPCTGQQQQSLRPWTGLPSERGQPLCAKWWTPPHLPEHQSIISLICLILRFTPITSVITERRERTDTKWNADSYATHSRETAFHRVRSLKPWRGSGWEFCVVCGIVCDVSIILCVCVCMCVFPSLRERVHVCLSLLGLCSYFYDYQCVCVCDPEVF